MKKHFRPKLRISDTNPTQTTSNKTGNAKKGARSNSIQDQLEKAAKGLTYSSESDFPYLFFSLPAWGITELTEADFLSVLGLSSTFIEEIRVPRKKFIEEKPINGFFPSLADLADYYGTTTSDPKVIAESKRFRELEAILKRRLKSVKVFRVGDIETHYYVTGIHKNNAVGLVTVAIET